MKGVTLIKLILSDNNIRSIPAAIADLVNLEYLDISQNPLKVKDEEDITCLPLDMRLMKNLRYLNISECNIRFIPTTVWLITSIKHLDISRNKIGLLVPDVANLDNLEKLNLSQCNLTTLPPEICFCTELTEIILMSNKIESLPESLKECKNLKFLRVSYKNFTSLIDDYMENLIRKNQIKSEHIPAVVFELENLSILDLKNTKTNNIPENNLIKLHELLLDKNYFDTISEGSLKPMSKSLRVLTLTYNFLKEIPEEIGCLNSLEILDLSHNQIEKLPPTRIKFTNLSNLKELYLNNNLFKSLTDVFYSFKKLEKLNLEKNQLENVDDSLYELDNLNYLDFSDNHIRFISPNISTLKQIKQAHAFDKFNNKTGLWLLGNPLEIPIKEIWQTMKIDKIYDYLNSYEQRNLEYNYYSSMIFFGASSIGKSKLINNLFDVKFEVQSSAQESNLKF
jgi:Leucine-rich repeat (LRR) protein